MVAVRTIREGEGFTLVHSADLHLGSAMRIAKRLGVEDRLQDATFEALDNLVRVTERTDAAFLTLGGDLFDVPNLLNPGPRRRLAHALDEIPRTQVAIVRGNHDHHHKDAPHIAWPANVFEFEGQRKTLDAGWVRLHGVSYARQHEQESLLPRYPAADPHHFDIGLLHANVGGNGEHAPYAPCTVADLTAHGYRMWLLGHIHKRAVLSEEPLIVYPGNLQGRDIGETGARTVEVIDVSPSGRTRTRPVPVHSILWARLTVDVSDCHTEDDVFDRAGEHVDAARRDLGGARGLIARLRLVGQTPAHARLARVDTQGSAATTLQEYLNQRHSERDPFALIDKVEVATTTPLDLERLAESDDIAGLLVRMARDDDLRQTILAELAVKGPDDRTELQRRAADLWDEALQGALMRLKGGEDAAH